MLVINAFDSTNHPFVKLVDCDKLVRFPGKINETVRQPELAHFRGPLARSGRDFLVYFDGHSALRSGDSGRFEKHLQIVGIMYQGMPGLKNYRQATMEFNATRAHGGQQ